MIGGRDERRHLRLRSVYDDDDDDNDDDNVVVAGAVTLPARYHGISFTMALDVPVH